uniref:Peptidase_M14 domain-containing protein n=1 Tax=Mesocestoides corti TaxID=53468 RepID=A0A5K3F9R9_MESCO
MQDYNYMETNCFEITLELGCSKYPPAKDLPRYWEENRKSLLNFILQAHEGIKGFVFGYQDGEVKPLSNAIIMVMNVTSRRNPELINHPIYSNKKGDYFRLLTKGRYFVAAMQPGFYPAFWVAHVPEAPDLDSRHFHEATKMNFLLIKADKSTPYGNDEYVEKATRLIPPTFRTSFVLGSEERAWLDHFLEQLQGSSEVIAMRHEEFSELLTPLEESLGFLE